MSNNWSLKVEGVSKKFGLSLREVMKYGLRDSLRRLVGVSDHTGVLRPGEFWAVKDVTFELEPGASLGIMGVNGSGKSTLLRILHGIYNPDAGKVMLKGRVGALIAAGAGFAPMLTGKENIHVSGAMLGMTPREINARMDDIINFAELSDFIDMPVKHYSSGMFVRLGFAIAAMSRPEILLIDEVLAVGDMNFQKKCYEYLFRLKHEGTTIVLVSHAVGAIWAVCDRGIFLHEGEMKVAGTPEDIIRAYDNQNFRSALQGRSSSASNELAATSDETEGNENGPEALLPEYGHQKGGTGEATVTNVRVFGQDGETPRKEFDLGEPLILEMDVIVKERIEAALFRFVIDAVHYKFIAVLDTYEQNLKLDIVEPGRYILRVKVDRQNFRPGTYTINVSIQRRHMYVHIFYWFGAGQILITHPKDRFLIADPNAILHLDGEFSLDKVGQ